MKCIGIQHNTFQYNRVFCCLNFFPMNQGEMFLRWQSILCPICQTQMSVPYVQRAWSLLPRLQRWSIFRAMWCWWFIFQQRCDTDYFLERLNIAIIAIIFLDHRERLFFDYFAHFEDRLFCDYSRSAPSFHNSYSGQIETIFTLNSFVN